MGAGGGGSGRALTGISAAITADELSAIAETDTRNAFRIINAPFVAIHKVPSDAICRTEGDMHFAGIFLSVAVQPQGREANGIVEQNQPAFVGAAMPVARRSDRILTELSERCVAPEFFLEFFRTTDGRRNRSSCRSLARTYRRTL